MHMRFFYIVLVMLLSPRTFAQQRPVSCGTSDENLPREILDRMARLPELLESQRNRTSAGEMRICRVGIEIDYQTYLQFDGDTNLITRKVYQDIAKVSEVYEKEINTRVVVAGIRFWKDANTDPFRVTDNTYSLISILLNLPVPDFESDKRIYLYTKQLSGPGGIAYLGGNFNISALGIPELIMHELGHNFGSPHTHNCAWPGGPIDFCAGVEGNCYDGVQDGRNRTIGTIMSYCAISTTFHPHCQALMKNYAENALIKIAAAPAIPQLNPLSSLTPGDFYVWKVIPAALSYEVLTATSPDFSDAQTSSTAFNGISLTNLPSGVSRYIKVRAINTFGVSGWSEVAVLQTTQPDLARPVLNAFPEAKSIFESGSPVTLTYQAVPGATSYEIQLTAHIDPNFFYPIATLNSATLSAEFRSDYSGLFRWRVRAVKGDMKGRWSEIDNFSVNPKVGSQFFIPTENLNALPTSFPFAYYTTAFNSKSAISISRNSNFSDCIYQKEFTSFWGAMDMISNLPSNTDLYVRVEEWNEDEQNYPKRKIADYSFKIKTSSDPPLGNLTFISGIDVNVFNVSRPKIAVTNKSVWLESPSYGLVRLDKYSNAFEIYDRDNTEGLISNTYISKPLLTDANGHINVLSLASNGSMRRVVLPSEAPGDDVQISKISFPGDIEGYSPAHRLYWNSSGIYRLSYESLNAIKLPGTDRRFAQVAVAGNKVWVLQNDNYGGGEVIVLDPNSGHELERFSNGNYPDLLYYIDQMVVNDAGQILLRQYDPAVRSYRVALWANGKWSAYTEFDSAFSGSVQSIAVSSRGEFYLLTKRTGHGIYRYEDGQWKEIADIRLNNIADNLVPDDHDNIWLTGEYGLIRVNTAQFDLTSIDKTDHCQGDTLTAIVNVSGNINTQKPFSAIFTKNTGQSVQVTGLNLQGSLLLVKIPDGLSGSGISLQLKSTEPEILTPSKRQLNVHELPTATILVDKTVLIPDKDTAAVGITLTGESPWSFKLWNNTQVTSETAVYSTSFVLTQPNDFELKISELSDKYCTIQMVKNSVKITPNIVAGNTEPALPAISIYPNPVSNRILVHFEQQAAQASHYFISDLQGSLIDSLKTTQKLTEWDISNLNAGSYILWTVQKGIKRSWKIVKN